MPSMYQIMAQKNPEKYPANMGKAWLEDELTQVLKEVKEGKSVQEIAALHQRTPGSIKSRLKQIAADYYFNNQLPFDKIKKYTGLSPEEIADAIARREAQAEKKKQSPEKVEWSAAPVVENMKKEVDPDIKEILKTVKEMQATLADFLAGNYVRIKKS